jgi:hypothetical protein
MSDLKKRKDLEALKYQGREWDKEFYKKYVYSDKLLSGYLENLKIDTEEGQEKMADSILNAAMHYESAKRSHIESYASSGQIERDIRALDKPLEKLIKKLEEMNSLGHHDILKSYRNIASTREISNRELYFSNALFCNEPSSNKINPYGFLDFLKTYRESCNRALQKDVSKNAAHKSFPLETWLLNLNHDWALYSPIPLIAGKYHEGIGYNSDAIHILKDIMSPLDSSIAIHTIANKLIEINEKITKK